MMVDSYHAVEKPNSRSCTVFMIFLNIDLITRISKKQPTVESAMFGADFLP